jgi:ribosome-associated toxin RatA of RatAB toxin-antitoxin module
MADAASETTTISASPEQCYAIAADFERYPEWAHDVKEAIVRARDSEGRATEVEFRASALGRSTHYVLGYDYDDAPSALRWRLVKGDIMRSLDGAYNFAPSSTPGATDVRYDVSIDLVVPIPGFVKRRAEVRILSTLKELKARAEA